MTITNTLMGLTLGYIILETIAFLAAMWVLYLVIKSAIRDGINESELARRSATFTQPNRRKWDRGGPDTMPDMHAD